MTLNVTWFMYISIYTLYISLVIINYYKLFIPNKIYIHVQFILFYLLF